MTCYMVCGSKDEKVKDSEDTYKRVAAEITTAMQVQQGNAKSVADVCLKTFNAITPDSKVNIYLKPVDACSYSNLESKFHAYTQPSIFCVLITPFRTCAS